MRTAVYAAAVVRMRPILLLSPIRQAAGTKSTLLRAAIARAEAAKERARYFTHKLQTAGEAMELLQPSLTVKPV